MRVLFLSALLAAPAFAALGDGTAMCTAATTYDATQAKAIELATAEGATSDLMKAELSVCGLSLIAECTDQTTCKAQLVKYANIERVRKALELLSGACTTAEAAAESVAACAAAGNSDACAAVDGAHGCAWTSLSDYNTMVAEAETTTALNSVGSTIVQNLACATAADDNTATQIVTDVLKANNVGSAAETLATINDTTEAAVVHAGLLACMASDTAGTGRAAEITTVVNTMVDSCHTTASDGTETTKQPLCEAHNYTEGTCTADETNSCSWTVATVTGLTASVKTQLPLTIAAAIEARANASPASALSTFTVLVATMYALFN